MASISAYLLSPKPLLLPRSSLTTRPPRHTLSPFRLHTPHWIPKLRVRVSVPVLRASAEAIRPGGGVEMDKLPSDVRNRAMAAVDSCGGRVTIGDVVGRAGIKVGEAERALQALAADTGGFLEVSDEGDVLYVFQRDYRSKLVAKSFRMKVEPLLDKVKAGGEYLIRVSFGTALLASIVLVYTTIIALISSRSDEDNRGRRGGRSYDSGFTLFFSPSDLFWYWDPYYYRRRQIRKNGGMNFVESVFSFVFGDGDPNQGLEEERWKMWQVFNIVSEQPGLKSRLACSLSRIYTQNIQMRESNSQPTNWNFNLWWHVIIIYILAHNSHHIFFEVLVQH